MTLEKVLECEDITRLIESFFCSAHLDATSKRIKAVRLRAGQYKLTEEASTKYLTDKQFRDKISARFTNPSFQLHLIVRATIRLLVSDRFRDLINLAKSVDVSLYPEISRTSLWHSLKNIKILRIEGFLREVEGSSYYEGKFDFLLNDSVAEQRIHLRDYTGRNRGWLLDTGMGIQSRQICLTN